MKVITSKLCFAFSVAFCLTGCLQDEIPVKPYDRGSVITVQISMQPDYRYQIWYDLSSQKMVSQNEKSAWDLAFSHSHSDAVFLNTALLAAACDAKTTDFGSVLTDDGLSYKVDKSDGSIDSLALFSFSDGNVFIIDRGFNLNGFPIGKKKIQLIDKQSESCTFHYANLDGSDYQLVTLSFDLNYRHSYFSFNQHAAIIIEPKTGTWDLCFTQYTHAFFNPYTPYLVTGVFTNMDDSLLVAKIRSKSFREIAAEDAKSIDYQINRDIIGYEWKSYNFSTNRYDLDPDLSYIIKDKDGILYKLHFIDFYDDYGQKGAPRFEYQRL